MRPILYELSRNFRSRIFLITIVAIIVISIIPAASLNYNTSAPAPDSSVRTDYGYYLNGSEYHIVNFVHNAYGEPYQGARYSISLNGHSYSAISNSVGFANISISESIINGTARIQESHSVGTSTFPYSIPLNASRVTYLAGDNTYNVSYIVTGVYNPQNPRLNNLFIYYLGKDGKASPTVDVYWSTSSSNYSSAALATSAGNSTLIKSIGGFRNTVITPNIPYRTGVYSTEKLFFITIINSNNTKPEGTYPVNLIIEVSPTTTYEFLFSELGSTFQIFVPLLAIISSYQIYAYDRISGTIESVVTRPVTKSQIMLTRYVANIIALGVSIMVSAEVLNLFSISSLGVSIPLKMIVLIIWAFFVEASAFTGIMFTVSHITKSNACAIGLTIFLYIGFNILWTLVTQIYGNGSPVNYLSPGGYFLLVRYYVFNALFPTSPVVIVGHNPDWSVYMDLLFLGGFLWITIPLLTVYALCKIRD